jgi:glycogen debranching enzyme
MEEPLGETISQREGSHLRKIPRAYIHSSSRLPTDYSKPIHVDLPISHAGAFVYWIEYDGDNPGDRIKGRHGYFNIDPILKIKARTAILDPETSAPLLPANGGAVISKDRYVNLPLNGLAILTLVSKWMGPIDQWIKHFEEASERGYTMLHWTPLQERGESGSPYSIKSQLRYDASAGGTSIVEQTLKLAREEYGLLSMTDVVLNHTANDSPWLLDHPEAGSSFLLYATIVYTYLYIFMKGTAQPILLI